MKIMLINSILKEETRIAILDNNKLCYLNIDNNINVNNRYNIYKGKIVKFEKSLDAFFVNYGSKKNGFLPIKEIYNFFFHKDFQNFVDCKNKTIFLKKDLYVLVQILKEETGDKGAFLTTYISLPGIYSVLTPYNVNKKGISKKIIGNSRSKIKSFISYIKIPNKMGFIIRTAGLNISKKIIQKDINIKINLWNKIKKKYKKIIHPSIIHKEDDIIIKIFRDCLYSDVDKIIIDNIKILKRIYKYFFFIKNISFLKKILIYKKKIPLFIFYKIESKIINLFKRKIMLQSGGSITIDSTEALTVIDINSFKSKKFNSIEATAFNTNMEAIEEIFYQIKIRNIGGLIVIDLIDMEFFQNQKILYNRLKKIIKKDTARIKFSNISKFGLLEISRQRLKSIFIENNYYLCKKCNGGGFLLNNKYFLLSIFRLLEEKMYEDNTCEVNVIIPIESYKYLNKENIKYINNIKKRQKEKKIIFFFSDKIKFPNFFIFNIYKERKKKNKIKKIIKMYNTINTIIY
ncbi:Rne/Rng family ribonuclease [Buchnera aphidicola]|uniref:Rne/Rng family ribonuclease n=1 Tax=Buchnera aphidicola TaxID=9 RepID=UPI0031B846C6